MCVWGKMLYRLGYKPSSQSENHLRESASEQRQSLFFPKINIHGVIHSKFLHKGKHMHSRVLQTAGFQKAVMGTELVQLKFDKFLRPEGPKDADTETAWVDALTFHQSCRFLGCVCACLCLCLLTASFP